MVSVDSVLSVVECQQNIAEHCRSEAGTKQNVLVSGEVWEAGREGRVLYGRGVTKHNCVVKARFILPGIHKSAWLTDHSTSL